jgi:hypothetical protein
LVSGFGSISPAVKEVTADAAARPQHVRKHHTSDCG